MDTATPKTIDEYLSHCTPEVQQALEDLRQFIRKLTPDAEESISYQIPTFKWNGGLVAFAGFKNHCSFFPMTNQIPESLKEEAKLYFQGKSTLRFTPESPLPRDLVEKIVKYRMQVNEMNMLAKKQKKK